MCSKSPTSKRARRSIEDGNTSLDLTDRISNLPDALLEHILSFLPTQQAVQTALLSRRWRFVWTLVPSLEFCYDRESGYFGENDGEDLTFFVNKVLIVHRAQPLDRFCLRCLASLDPINVAPWIVAATLRCVRELDLRIPRCALPTSIFASKTLEVLKLNDCLVKVPSSVYLPRLKILHLVHIVYPSCKLANAFVSRILSGCPVLEELTFVGYGWEDESIDEVMMLRICTPTLKRFELRGPDDGCGDVYSKIEIKAPALKYLKLCFMVCDKFLIQDSPDILEAYFFEFRCMEEDVETLLGCIPKVETLHLRDNSWRDEIRSMDVPKLEYLKYLELTCGFFESLHALCESAPNLETLIINQDVAYGEEFHWSGMPNVPECLLCSLKRFGYFGFKGSQDELALVEYLMKHGLVLNLVTLKYYYQDSETEPSKWSILKKLAVFCRSSRTCQLEFS